MHGLAVGGDDSHAVSLDRHLGGTDGGEGVDHAEAVATSRGDCEDLEGSVGHEASVGIPELSLAVDQHGLGILASVDRQATRITLGRILVQPIADEHDVCGQIKVVQMRVGVT